MRVLAKIALAFLTLATQVVSAQAFRRNFNLDLEPVPDATGYEIEITPKNSGKVLVFKSPRPAFSANLKLGVYGLRVRSFDERGAPGPWSEASVVNVRYPALKLIAPKPGEILSDAVARNIEVDFTWEKIEAVRSYRLHIEPGGIDRVVSEPHARIALANGAKYTWTVTAIDARGSEGEMPESASEFTLRGPGLPPPEIEEPPPDVEIHSLAWRPVDGASGYRAELARFDSGFWQPVDGVRVEGTSMTTATALPEARYRLRVSALGSAPTVMDSAWAEREFGAPAAAVIQAQRDHTRRMQPPPFAVRGGGVHANTTYQYTDKNSDLVTTFTGATDYAFLGGTYKPQGASRLRFDGGIGLNVIRLAGQTIFLPGAQLGVTSRWSLGGRWYFEFTPRLELKQAVAVTTKGNATTYSTLYAVVPGGELTLRRQLTTSLDGFVTFAGSVPMKPFGVTYLRTVSIYEGKAGLSWLFKSSILNVGAGVGREVWTLGSDSGVTGTTSEVLIRRQQVELSLEIPWK